MEELTEIFKGEDNQRQEKGTQRNEGRIARK